MKTTTNHPFPPLKTTITFENVSFSYHDTLPILANSTLTIRRGERLGIVGPSGIGKSTISDLLLTFIAPTTGRILFDKNDLSLFSSTSVRAQIGYVGQHPFLFNDTVYANVGYANPQASMDDIIDACQRAYAHDFIMQLPDGYHTIVGENGKLLSGGQKQRLTIARALLRKPSLLIFDEATSALDHRSEEMINQTIQELDNYTTTIVITHRPALLKNMTRIVTIEKHNIVPISILQAAS